MTNNSHTISSLSFKLPFWALKLEKKYKDKIFFTDEEKMSLALEVCKKNIRDPLLPGGPFGAAIFNMQTNQLLALGMNRVVVEQDAALHAEAVAIKFACARLNKFNLALAGQFELFTTGEPCMMCLGHSLWSGVSRIVIAARDSDIRKIGFDEGLKPKGGILAIKKYGIELKKDCLRRTAKNLLNEYARQGQIYNGLVNQSHK